jgi:hypothetical protein
MKLHVDLSDHILVSSPRARTPIRKLTARRDDLIPVDVSFSTNGRVVPLPAGSTVTLVAYAGPGSRTPVVFANNASIFGRGASTVYRFPGVSFAINSVVSALASQGVVPLTFEVRVVSGYTSFSTSPVTLEVSQSASVAGAVQPAYETVPTAPLYLREIDALTGGGSNALDSVITLGRDGLLIMCYIASEMQTWRLFPGTDAENPSAGIVRPDDFDETSNPRVWKRLA